MADLAAELHLGGAGHLFAQWPDRDPVPVQHRAHHPAVPQDVAELQVAVRPPEKTRHVPALRGAGAVPGDQCLALLQQPPGGDVEPGHFLAALDEPEQPVGLADRRPGIVTLALGRVPAGPSAACCASAAWISATRAPSTPASARDRHVPGW